MKLHQGSVFIDGMVNSTEVVVHSKTNFVKVVQNQLFFRKWLMLCDKLILQDCHVTYSKIETTLGISGTSIYSILHEHLTVKKIFALDPTQAEQTHNLLLSILMLIPDSYLLCNSCILLRSYLLKRLYMSSLIANQVKTNMCSISVKFIIVLITFVPLYTLYWYSNNYNNNCLFNTTIRYSAHKRNFMLELYTHLVTRLLQLLLNLLIRIILPFYSPTYLV